MCQTAELSIVSVDAWSDGTIALPPWRDTVESTQRQLIWWLGCRSTVLRHLFVYIMFKVRLRRVNKEPGLVGC